MLKTPLAMIPQFWELVLAQLEHHPVGLDPPMILNDKLYVVEDRFEFLFEEFFGAGCPFTILICQLVLVVGILEDHDLLRCHKRLAPIHLRIWSILPHAVQLGVRTPVLATTRRDCAGPSGVRCDTAAIRVPAVVVLVHALDDAT